jgi:DNA-binding NarL/FixJ family response regulator
MIVDDHPNFRARAQRMLESAGYKVIGSVGDGETALAQLEPLRPDIVLVDIQLPGMDGFAVANHLTARAKAPIVVLISSRERDDYGSRIADSRAAGFISKAELSGDQLRKLMPT